MFLLSRWNIFKISEDRHTRDIQHDVMLFMINDPTKIRVFFGVLTDQLHQQILFKMI